ncbi:enoyl-CoA hydratase-related protein [Mycolicibacterium moriokaense]|nr:enoyl-CoA hydratase-related protein [Mycolicibacterium moriokaense]
MTTVRYAVESGVASIVLDRPPVNAYDDELHDQLNAAWYRAARDADARVIVVRAEGKHFCAGADMDAEHSVNRDPDAMSPPEEMSFIRNLMKPTIAAVQGGCVGGAQRFVFPCDLIFCSDDAFFSDPMVHMGIGGIPAPIHAWMYGPRLAKEMLFSGMRMPAQRLYAAGLVNRIYPRETLVSETLAFAREIAQANAAALRQAKRSVDITMDIAGQHYIANRFSEALDGESNGVVSQERGNGER